MKYIYSVDKIGAVDCMDTCEDAAWEAVKVHGLFYEMTAEQYEACKSVEFKIEACNKILGLQVNLPSHFKAEMLELIEHARRLGLKVVSKHTEFGAQIVFESALGNSEFVYIHES